MDRAKNVFDLDQKSIEIFRLKDCFKFLQINLGLLIFFWVKHLVVMELGWIEQRGEEDPEHLDEMLLVIVESI